MNRLDSPDAAGAAAGASTAVGSVGSPVPDAAGRHRVRLVPVRRRDVRRLRAAGPPAGGPLPARHGADGDPRYPSARELRRVVGVVLDLVLHLAGAVAVGLLAGRLPDPDAGAGTAILAGLGAFLGLSILHRVVVQAIAGTTAGKAVVGLCLIRDDTGGRPTLGLLVKAWLLGALKAVAGIVSAP